ncbi:MAG: ATP-binding cassette domain-containing protein [Methanoregulaceae archaeon]|nr:ATP-binding cassette domain-containing protein [Methanoregulaceae archaeon]
MSSVILEARDIHYRYPGGTKAIRGISFHVRRGEKIAIVGPNGAGKSTLMLMFNGMIRPDSGTFLFDNEPVLYDRSSLRELRRRVGFVFQNPDRQIIAPTVYQDVAFGPTNLGYSDGSVKSAVEKALRYVGLEGFERRPPHQLSGGEKKRLAIAGVLAMDPDLLVFDEPTSVLDPAGSEDIMELLEEMHQNGKTIIISTHDVELAYPWADRVILLREGEILEEGTPEVAFGNAELVRKARLSMPVLLELYQELVKRGLAEETRKPKSILEILNVIDGVRHVRNAGDRRIYGQVWVADAETVFSGGIGQFIREQSITGVGAMGSRSKARLKAEEVTPDYTYAVIDRAILLAMNGEHGLVIASGGMVQRVFDRIDEFNQKHRVEIRASRV